MLSLLRFSALLLFALPCFAAPGGVVVKKDLAYADTDDPHQMLDLYLPEKRKEADKPLPLVIYIHGGAWRSGDKSQAKGLMTGLVAGGEYAAASIAYRFTDQQPWPAQIHDCKAAVRYLRAHAKEYGLDADRFAATGVSAGGHLALLIGLDGGSRTLEGDLGATPQESSKVTCVADWFGPVQLETMTWPGAMFKGREAIDPQDELFGKSPEKRLELQRQASPVTYITPDDPPVFIAHGTVDPLVPFSQAELLNERLERAKVPVYLEKMEGGGHGFSSEELHKRLAAFLGRYLRGTKEEIPVTPIPVK
ncbi:alpha/beta hydrolase [Luteolibacter ambystomatis]|uniref:Alpha/beta hydrolase n=1 Tax=Luteolibacter ambystomatis TaxID=2824561 RepID=A0A975J2U7_9BACT|nr:alpha/beta hydrolase [Luteolibacter ambystomatis]QUE53025.1 alpha/beta hydrolase [Luteolibacter ambystomatis]